MARQGPHQVEINDQRHVVARPMAIECHGGDRERPALVLAMEAVAIPLTG
jgi:hypothetical protein